MRSRRSARTSWTPGRVSAPEGRTSPKPGVQLSTLSLVLIDPRLYARGTSALNEPRFLDGAASYAASAAETHPVNWAPAITGTAALGREAVTPPTSVPPPPPGVVVGDVPVVGGGPVVGGPPLVEQC